MQPKISIIVPVYKAEKYLHRCVDSILSQTFTDFELLLINDGSPDNSGAICDEYAQKDNRVRVFHKENGGVSSARNLGLDNAKGEWITFCDADDYVSEKWLMSCKNAVKDDIDIVFNGYCYITSTEKENRIPFSKNAICKTEIKKAITDLVISNCYGYIWLAVFKKSLIENLCLRFDEKSAFNEDAQFLSTYLENTKSFSTIKEANYYYMAPECGKKYKGDNYYSVLLTCQSFNTIFCGEIPEEICIRYFPYVKNGGIDYIIQGKDLESFHLELYDYMIKKMQKNQNIKDQVRNFLILNSRNLKFISRMGLKLYKTMFNL